MANPGERPDIEGKIELIGDRIVRGQAANLKKEVKFHRINRGVTIIATTLTSAGLSHPLLSGFDGKGTFSIPAATANMTAVPVWLSVIGIALFVSFLIARNWFIEEGFEKKAIQSLSLYESFVTLETKFDKNLQQQNPMPELTQTHANALALEETFSLIIPREDDALTADIDKFVKKKIQKNCRYWDAVPPDERS